MLSNILIYPLIIPFVTGLIGYPLRNHKYVNGSLGLLSLLLLLGINIRLLLYLAHPDTDTMLVLQLGNIKAPFGISFVADYLAVIMLLLCNITAIFAWMFSLFYLDEGYYRTGLSTIFFLLLFGIHGAFLTGDIFNLYVWFEVILIASFALFILRGNRIKLDAAVKYVVLNLLATLTFLLAVALLYGLTGSLNMAELHQRLQDYTSVHGWGALPQAVVLFFIVALGIKSAVFPLFFWLPASYHTLPVPIVALFSGIMTKVGVYAFIRLFTLIFPLQALNQNILLWIAGLTMLTGVMGAISHFEIKRILAFHSISQIGFMIMGLAIMTPLALTGTLFYMLHHGLVKSNLFLISGMVKRIAGTDDLNLLGGLYRYTPCLAYLFLFSAFALAGFPPFSGFWGKLMLIQAGLSTEHYVMSGIALLTGLLTTVSMLKIWNYGFWRPRCPGRVLDLRLNAGEKFFMLGSIVGGTLLILYLSIFPDTILLILQQAVAQLRQPEIYVQYVLP